MSGRVSVLVPTFNRARYIGECLESLTKQTVQPYEIIVIDDGSDDDTADRVRRHGDRVTYLRKENGGKSSALNLALPRVAGDFVWMFDDDDVALPDAIASASGGSRKRASTGIHLQQPLLGYRRTQSRRSRSFVSTICRRCLRIRSVLSILRDCYFTLQGVVVRKRCMDAVGRFDEGLLRSQDYQMLIRLARLFPAAELARPTFIFRRHDGQRGPAAIRHSVTDRSGIWSAFDQRIGRFIRDQFSLGEYLTPPAPSAPTRPLDLATALLNRAGVMATKGLIHEMLEDIGSVTAIGRADGQSSDIPVAQLDMLVKTVSHPYFQNAVSPDVDAFIASLSKVASGTAGGRILRAFSRGYFRYAKSFEGDVGARLNRLGIAARLGAASMKR